MNKAALFDWIWEPFFASLDEDGNWVPPKERMAKVCARANAAGVGERFEVYR